MSVRNPLRASRHTELRAITALAILERYETCPDAALREQLRELCGLDIDTRHLVVIRDAVGVNQLAPPFLNFTGNGDRVQDHLRSPIKPAALDLEFACPVMLKGLSEDRAPKASQRLRDTRLEGSNLPAIPRIVTWHAIEAGRRYNPIAKTEKIDRAYFGDDWEHGLCVAKG